jgi:hypothetical protein
MTTRTHPLLRIKRFFQVAVKHYPWTFWTVVVILAAIHIPVLIWPLEMGAVALGLWAVIVGATLFVGLIWKIVTEIADGGGR